MGSIPGLTQWVKDLALLWLWCRPAAAAPIQPLAWELPYATGAVLKQNKTKKQTKLSEHRGVEENSWSYKCIDNVVYSKMRNIFSLRLRVRRGCWLLLFLLSIVLVSQLNVRRRQRKLTNAGKEDIIPSQLTETVCM